MRLQNIIDSIEPAIMRKVEAVIAKHEGETDEQELFTIDLRPVFSHEIWQRIYNDVEKRKGQINADALNDRYSNMPRRDISGCLSGAPLVGAGVSLLRGSIS